MRNFLSRAFFSEKLESYIKAFSFEVTLEVKIVKVSVKNQVKGLEIETVSGR